ncbi:MAG: hypothetical protein ACJ76F_10790 [Bacteroidia bacterium]
MKKLLIFLSLLPALVVHSQSKNNDFTVILNEETLNKVFLAIGEINGSSDYEVLLVKGTYHWTVINPQISIRPDSSQFNCIARVKAGFFDYTTTVKGDVKITYDTKKNEIQVKITRAIFELYTMLFGGKVHIKDIDLADQFKDPFIFEGPRTMATDFEFTMPDSTVKHIYVQPTTCDMEIRWKEIVTRCEISASDKPYKPVPVKPASPDVAIPSKTPDTKVQPDSTNKPKDSKAAKK